jgi:valyl-tRNA synthetase
MENIRDWNISRQLWWGHRIPVWYCDACDIEPMVSRDDLSTCPRCDARLRQDEDVLDTWFSSWLWPISTLGWPNEESADLKAFYPTDALVTGPDILFFWVARMIMAGYAFRGETPFHTVYLHGIVRDTEHRKMSKSLGNGIDPLDVVRMFGADALRYTVIAGMGLGTDVILDPADLEKSFAPGRNFVTKLWNIGRFLLGNVGREPVQPLAAIDDARLTRADRWILARLDTATAECDAALGPARPTAGAWPEAERNQGLRLSEYAEAARRFVWNDLADWYLESTKSRFGPSSDAADREVARAVLVHAFDGALRLLHPIVPFVTEALWQRLPGRGEDEFLARASWPTVDGARGGGTDFDVVRQAVEAINRLRAEYAVPPGKRVAAYVVPPAAGEADAAILRGEAATIGSLARADVTYADTPDALAFDARQAAHVVFGRGAGVYVSLEGLIDVGKECARLTRELGDLEKQLTALRGRLANAGFTDRAPASVVEAERTKERDWTARRDQLAAKVAQLCGG